MQYEGELDPDGPIFAGKLYTGTGTPMLSPQHQFFASVEVGRIAVWQFRDNLMVNIIYPPLCALCELRAIGRTYVRLM